MNETIMKRHLFALLLACAALPAMAAETPAPLPVVVAESELFEIVGRLDTAGLILHVDTAPDNAPVLDASLGLELAGREIQAAFRPAEGDYLVADADWLAPLRLPGEHLLSFTLLAGDEADLLSGELIVDAVTPMPAVGWQLLPWLGGGLLAAFGLIGGVWFYRRRRGVQA
jgi:hypothetical protein